MEFSDKSNESQQWIEAEQKRSQLRSQRSQQFKLNLIYFARWIGSGWRGWLFYLGSFGIYISLGFALGVNFPSAIACPNTKSYCYLLRLDKETVVIPSNYIKQTSPKKSSRQR
ncbi:hypothetical protein H6H03_26700 [Nostoc paludosum FACHB-159]|uniref:Uncharacterized protein n=1 Tax=Nostoc paludosum FACHB-159 TaxID=2692908 RepID=A0ABR8KFA3_9NOSO|nr:hypothetical protein [Nostoc sp. FACHB-857]MBD2737431.1 hypothetical protein [Nostoc paludosum FACHB-159]